MTDAQRRGLNNAVTGLWTILAPAYDLPILQRRIYRPPHDDVIAALRSHGSRKIADIACGTGILSDRIERELRPDEIYGVDMSDGMLAQARSGPIGCSGCALRPSSCPSTTEPSTPS